MIGRRSFLALLLATTALTPVPVDAGLLHRVGSNAPPATAFYGNPNVNISSIDVSGGIELSRASGQTPAFVQVSACNIGLTGTAVNGNVSPYEDAEYRWDFGDPFGTETFTDPNQGTTVNANSDQIGPEAAYCYRTAGSYTITLNIKAKTSSGYITSQVTGTFVATAFSGTVRYFDSNSPAGSGGNGLTPATAWNDPTLQAHMAGMLTSDDQDVRIARGSTWTVANDASLHLMMVISGSRIRIGPYTPVSGLTANPVFTVDGSNGNNKCISMAPLTAKSDIVISSIDLIGNGAGIALISVQPVGGTLADFYMDKIRGTQNSTQVGTCLATVRPDETAVAAGQDDMVRVGRWGTQFTRGSSMQGFGDQYGAQSWNFWLGTSIVGANGRVNLFDHAYNCETTDNHGLFRWCSQAGSTGGIAVNGNVYGHGPFHIVDWQNNNLKGYGKFYLIADCNFAESGGGVEFNNVNNSPYINSNDRTGLFQFCIIERTAIHNTAGGSVQTIQSCISFTSRDNWFWGVTSGAQFFKSNGVDPNGSGLSCYPITNITHDGIGTATCNSAYRSNGIVPVSPFSAGFNVSGGPISVTIDSGAYAGNYTGTVIDGNTFSFPFPGAGHGTVTGGTYRPFPAYANLNTLLYAKHYRNRIYYPSGNATQVGAWSYRITNAGTNWTVPQVFTDNVIVDARANGNSNMFQCTVADFTAIGPTCFFDRNQYYAPSDPSGTSAHFDDASLGSPNKTFAQWKTDLVPCRSGGIGGEQNSIYALPAWTLPITQVSDFGP